MKSIWFLILCAVAPVVCGAQAVSFDATTFPEEASPPWARSNRPYLPERWIDNGWFVQQTEMQSYDPYTPEDDLYRRSVAEFSSVSRFFAEWRMQTDGNDDHFSDVAPAVLVVGGSMGVRFHFTIARDRVCFFDSYVNIY